MRKLAAAFLSVLAFAGITYAQSPGTPISGLPQGGLMRASDIVPAVRNGVTIQTNPYAIPTVGQVYVSNGTSAPQGIAPINGNCLYGTGGIWSTTPCGTGTVYSINFAGDGILDSSTPTSNITTSGTLTATPLTQSANLVLAGPTSGIAAHPSFRALVGADLPNPSASTKGGIESLAAITHQYLTSLSTSGVLAQAQPSTSDLSDISTFNLSTSGTATAASFNATGSSAPANGFYEISANDIGITAGSTLLLEGISNSTGGDYNTLENAVTTGFAAVTAPTAATSALAGGGAGNLSAGAYKYKITYAGTNGETTLGTVSNTTTVVTPGTNGKISLTSIPVSGSGLVSSRKIYRTTAGGSSYFYAATISDNTTTTYTDNIADTSLTYSAPTSFANTAQYTTFAAAGTTDTSVGINHNSIGTTTTGLQFMGAPVNNTGEQFFNINGQHALEITDNWWNPNSSYQGATTAWPVISSGALAGGPDNIAVIGVNSSIYPATATGTSLALMLRGVSSEFHVFTNGYNAFTVAGGTNPLGVDTDNTSSYISMSGVPSGSANTADSISVQSSSNTNAPNLNFYTSGAGSFDFLSDNTSTNLFQITRTSLSGDGLSLTEQATGSGPVLESMSSGSNTPLSLASKGSSAVNLKTEGTVTQAQITDTASAVNLVEITGGQTGNAAQISAGGSGADTNAELDLSAKGSSAVRFKSNGVTAGSVSAAASAVNYINFSAQATGIAPSISSQNSGGTPGMLLYTTDSGNISFQSDNTSTLLMNLIRGASGGDGLNITAQTAGSGALLATHSSSTNSPVTLEGQGTGNTILGGHVQSVVAGTASPTCGTGCTSITSNSTDTRGSLTSSSAVTSIVLDFGTTWGATPFCVIGSNQDASLWQAVPSTSIITITTAAAVTSKVFTWICMQ